MKDRLAACVLTGREAGADGVCAEHGGPECVITVEVARPVFECVIPGYECTHGHHHIREVEWQPIERPDDEPPTDPPTTIQRS